MKWICKNCPSCDPCELEIKGHDYVNPTLCPFFLDYEGIWEIEQE